VAFTFAQGQTAESNGGESEFEVGESHCTLGGIGLILLIATLAAGFLVSGRFGRIAAVKPLPVHKVAVVVMASFLTVEFLYGSTVRSFFFMSSLHGALGFLTTAAAWLTVSLNPLVLRRAIKWKRASGVHLILAGSLFTLLLIHLGYAFSIFE
jgi:hypothetical protein